MMRRWLFALLLLATPALGDENLVSGVSQDLIQITSNYTGSDIVVFGDVEQQQRVTGRDIVVVVRGPDTVLTVRRRDRVAGVWINHDAADLSGMPAFYYLASSRPLARYGIGVASIEPDTVHAHHDVEPFRQAALRLMTEQGLYREVPSGVEFLSDTLFRAHVPVPAGVSVGQYDVEVYLIRGGNVESAQSTPLFIDQTGLERRLYNWAHDQPFGYGLAAVVMALLMGWISSVIFRRPA
jgi:uncharacterized protein (TIGR02186 family)